MSVLLLTLLDLFLRHGGALPFKQSPLAAYGLIAIPRRPRLLTGIRLQPLENLLNLCQLVKLKFAQVALVPLLDERV